MISKDFHGVSACATPTLATSDATSESARHLVNATIQHLEANSRPSSHGALSGGTDCRATALRAPFRTAKWVERHRLMGFGTQNLVTAAIDFRASNKAHATRENHPTAVGEATSLPMVVLSPETRAALTALSRSQKHLAPLEATFNADSMLDVLNYAPRDMHGAVAMEALLTPQAQAGLTALAEGTRSVGSSEELLGILNADAWAADVLGPKAREALSALARDPGPPVMDSNQVLEFLNAGTTVGTDVEYDMAQDSGNADFKEPDPDDIVLFQDVEDDDDFPVWAPVVEPEDTAALAEWSEEKLGEIDDLLARLNAQLAFLEDLPDEHSTDGTTSPSVMFERALSSATSCTSARPSMHHTRKGKQGSDEDGSSCVETWFGRQIVDEELEFLFLKGTREMHDKEVRSM
ncbi:hypothetical protein DFH07DRAFT_964652 [Mycena maculata]|uniref:Uncharacterized protein n=1 Tax=Mycena maculata TaxID=230809 RepID=A0AAD7N1Y6_9AGAR|nr:hypothetical protein DFH07DRAFT_964652 [Mycena maculata]